MIRRVFLAVLVGIAVPACAGGEEPVGQGKEVASAPAEAATTAVKLVKAFPSLRFENPTDMASPPDGTGRLFVLEQPGRVRVFANDPAVKTAATFLDLTGIVASGGEMGLLGIAFHPAFKTNRTFYLNYTADNPRRTVIARYRQQQANANLADPKGEVILEFDQPYSNHNGGQLAFGPDGHLYIGTGDGGAGGDPHGHGQNRKTLLGSWLRIDVNGTSGERAYRIPADNPYAGNSEGFREEIYAYGLRNLWRFSHDAETNRWWGADVGQNRLEEIDILEKGKNYGWNIMEGTDCYQPKRGCDKTGLTLPIAEYDHSQGQSVTGGYVYRGQRRPDLVGAYIYGDFVSGRVWALRYDGAKVTENKVILESGLNIASFAQDAGRELYALAFDGSIYRFE